MRRDRRILAAMALLVVAAFLIFLSFLEGGESALGPGRGAEGTREAPIEEATVARRHADPGREVLAREREAAEAKAVPDLDDHLPRHGPELFSGDAQALFTIRDARDQRLPVSARLSAQLYRLESGTRLCEGLTVAAEEGLVRCAGTVGDGLEPGRYALRVRAGPYGGFWKDFELARGQVIEERLQLETWTRVVRLRFVDREGQPLPRLPVPPRYSAADLRVPDRKFGSGPGILLREPPGNEWNEAIGIGHGGSSGGRGGSRSWATLDGCWFLQVVAGQEGKIHLGFSESRDGLGTTDLVSRFLEADWDDHEIVLDPQDEQRARLARYPLDNPEDPGNQSALVIPQPQEPPADPLVFDPDLPGWSRHILRGPAIANLKLDVREPPYTRSMHHLGRHHADRRARFDNGLWFSDLDLSRDEPFAWTWQDGALLETPPRELAKDALGKAGEVIEHIDRFDHLPLEVAIEAVSPTFDAWARGVELLWSDSSRTARERDGRLTRRAGDRFRVATALVLDADGEPRFGRSLWLRFLGDARWSSQGMTMPFTEEMAAAARAGELSIRPAPQGLVFRALDEGGRALPWVEGSVLELERLLLAERVRETMRSAGVDVAIQTGFLADDLDRTALSALDEKSDISRLEKHIGTELWQALGDAAARLHVGRNGAWYDPWRKIRADDRGYGVALGLKLVPGRRYALWLWSRSRDAYRPDRLVVFTASEGLTDLGLLTLPRWTGD